MRVITRLDETCREVRDAARVIGDAELFKRMEEAQNKIKRDSECQPAIGDRSPMTICMFFQLYSQPVCISEDKPTALEERHVDRYDACIILVRVSYSRGMPVGSAPAKHGGAKMKPRG